MAFRGGGEAVSVILGGDVTVDGSGYTAFGEYILVGRMRAHAVTSGTRLPGIDAATLEARGQPARDDDRGGNDPRRAGFGDEINLFACHRNCNFNCGNKF